MFSDFWVRLTMQKNVQFWLQEGSFDFVDFFELQFY